MASENVIDKAAIAQTETLLGQIANDAATIDTMCAYFDSDNVVALEAHVQVLRSMVERMGWMADLANKKLTGMEKVKGNAEQWMTSPAYLQLQARPAQ